jgi:cell division protease FtsH
LLAGHAGEELIFDETTTGPHNDIEQATKMARQMVTSYGMSRTLGPRTFGHKEEMVFLGREISEQRDYSEKVAQQIDDEVQNIIQKAYDTAKTILNENKKRLVHIASQLLNHETLEGGELEKLFTGAVPASASGAATTS